MRDNAELYTRWLAYRKQIATPDRFSKKVMAAVDDTVAQQPSDTIGELPSFVHHPLAQWLTASGLVALGLARILYITGSLLRANPVMP